MKLPAILSKLKEYFPQTHKILKYSRPNFLGQNSPLEVLSHLVKRIANGVITERAASISFSFILSLFPAVIFVFTLIPYTPVANYQTQIFTFLEEVLPPGSYDLVAGTIKKIIGVKRGELLWSTLLITLFLATNGTMSLMANFASTADKEFVKNFSKRYLSAVLVTLLFFLVTLSAIVLMVVGTFIINVLSDHQMGMLPELLISVVRFTVIVSMLLTLISLLYRFGPLKLSLRELITPGSLFATLGMLVSSVGFSWYVRNFSNFESLYGSIGTLPMIMLWIYLNAISLILGYEINTLIAELVYQREQENKDILENNRAAEVDYLNTTSIPTIPSIPTITSKSEYYTSIPSTPGKSPKTSRKTRSPKK